MKIDLTPIIKETRTIDDVRVLRAGVEALEMSMHGLGEKSWHNVLDKVLPEKFSVHLKDWLAPLPAAQQPETLKELLVDLKNALSKFRPLKIDLAFEPTNEVIDQLNFWVDEKLGLEVALDIGYEKTLIGGVRIIFAGRYGDFSMAKYFEDILSREKENILKRSSLNSFS